MLRRKEEARTGKKARLKEIRNVQNKNERGDNICLFVCLLDKQCKGTIKKEKGCQVNKKKANEEYNEGGKKNAKYILVKKITRIFR